MSKPLWKNDFLKQIVGPWEATFLSCAKEEDIRKGAASGGAVTALLISLLNRREVDGALVWKVSFDSGEISCRPFIARTAAEVISARTSKYIPAHFLREGIPLIRAFEGKLALVLLPCDASAMRRAMVRQPDLADKIHTIICLFCGHNSESTLTYGLLRKLGVQPSDVESLRYRTGHWRGTMTITARDDTVIEVPTSRFTNYQSLFFFAQKKCIHCSDHFGYASDISAGDLWNSKARRDPVKRTALIARNKLACEHIRRSDQYLECMPLTASEILDGQARGALFHFNTSARSKVGKLFGLSVTPSTKEKPLLSEYLSAIVCLANYRLSKGSYSKYLFRVPTPLIRLYLYAFKAIQQWTVFRKQRSHIR